MPIKAKIFKVANNFILPKEIKVQNLNKYDMTVKDNPQYVTEFIYEITSELKSNEVNYNNSRK
jgi:hypothetical protein